MKHIVVNQGGDDLDQDQTINKIVILFMDPTLEKEPSSTIFLNRNP